MNANTPINDVLELESAEWLADCFAELTTELLILKPSEWAEKYRYLPPSVTPLPGYYSFAVAPYLIEIVDNMSPFSPIREIDVLKGVQTCFTVGVIENTIGYCIAYVKNAPVMFLTADAELAKTRIEQYITPMLTHSGLDDLIKSSDERNTRKTGKTDKKIEWVGGGWLIPYGAQNANKLRSISIQYLLEDEIDSYPDKVGKDGDPLKLAQDRTAAYESTRKICRGSTPLITQTSKATREYNKGDMREYQVPCKHCGKKQKMVWHGTNADDGTVFGIVWTLDDDNLLVPGSVRYVCKFCQGEWENDDKTWMYRERGKHCEWVPTSRPVSQDRRSYHISALYSPVGMQTWETQVLKFFDAWDPVNQKIINIESYQTFRNNVEGLAFEMRGEQLKYEIVRQNRSIHYESGSVPNKLALEQTGSRILLLTASVDVHNKHLDVLVQGFCRDGRQYSIDWFVIEGNCADKNDSSWQELSQFIDEKVYLSDDGHAYTPRITLVDSQYLTDTVYGFCNQYSSGVYASQGIRSTHNAQQQPFIEWTTKTGIQAFKITVDMYKDRLASQLKQEWSGRGFQPHGHMNYPKNYPNKFFKELTKEQKVQDVDKLTGRVAGFRWHRPGGGANHAWDLSVYCTAGLDMLALAICIDEFKIEYINFNAFWDFASTGAFTVKGSFDSE